MAQQLPDYCLFESISLSLTVKTWLLQLQASQLNSRQEEGASTSWEFHSQTREKIPRNPHQVSYWHDCVPWSFLCTREAGKANQPLVQRQAREKELQKWQLRKPTHRPQLYIRLNTMFPFIHSTSECWAPTMPWARCWRGLMSHIRLDAGGEEPLTHIYVQGVVGIAPGLGGEGVKKTSWVVLTMTGSKPGIWSGGRQGGCPCSVPGRGNSMCKGLAARQIITSIQGTERSSPRPPKVIQTKRIKSSPHRCEWVNLTSKTIKAWSTSPFPRGRESTGRFFKHRGCRRPKA